ncbi:molybdopterin converting factor, subunit 2 [Citrobacter freundii]|uniref:Molybdopterin synthase catalytic subunit n=1 Tax=Citrobacter freundii TaxID=546 RepID=A0A7G2IIU5_CITFR|nr:molybdopterin converting factor, subunit 2 [Citrobacter freundii]
MAETRIVVGPAPFRVGDEYPWLAERDEDGAVVTFTGKVRNHNLGDSVKALTLEHYPGMTEKALAEIVDEARFALAAGSGDGDSSHWRTVAG